jgi:hypothetical protein
MHGRHLERQALSKIPEFLSVGGADEFVEQIPSRAFLDVIDTPYCIISSHQFFSYLRTNGLVRNGGVFYRLLDRSVMPLTAKAHT